MSESSDILSNVPLELLLKEVYYRAEDWKTCAVGNRIEARNSTYPKLPLLNLGFSETEANTIIEKGMRFTHLAEELGKLYREIQHAEPGNMVDED